MADNIVDAFLLMIDENDEARLELDRRIREYPGDRKDITREVFIPFATEHGYAMTEADVDLYNGFVSDGSEVPDFLRDDDRK